jgi:hypothetical protein
MSPTWDQITKLASYARCQVTQLGSGGTSILQPMLTCLQQKSCCSCLDADEIPAKGFKPRKTIRALKKRGVLQVHVQKSQDFSLSALSMLILFWGR